MSTFPFNIYAAALFSAGAASALSLPLWRRWCLARGLVDDPGHRKIHSTPIPLAGGLAVLTGILLPLLAGIVILLLDWLPGASQTLLEYGFHRRLPQLITILLGAVGMVLLGGWDDKYELRPALKFAGQFSIAAAVALAGIRITLFVPSPAFSFAVTVLWILTLTNAFNFMDNMNGLCGGLGAIGAWLFAASAAVHGQYLVVVLALLTAGALLGFLPYNFPHATAFLGDAGSHLTGYLLAVLAILPDFYTAEFSRPVAVLGPLLILAVPLWDLVSVVVIRTRNRRPFYIGDTNHLSHRLARRGFSRTQAVLTIWGMAAAFGALRFALP